MIKKWNDKALEAAAVAVHQSDELLAVQIGAAEKPNPWEGESDAVKNVARRYAREAITAYHASLEEQGLRRGAACYEKNNYWHTGIGDDGFPVHIERDEI